ncbi:MAG TPA: hypothetical protein VLZ54_00230 [Arenibacter sp.]|nr:hypothetical protein [Arenibacter sp.]
MPHVLTIIGSFLAQVNAYVLCYTVDQLAELTEAVRALNNGVALLATISVILLGKELIFAEIKYGQKFYGYD